MKTQIEIEQEIIKKLKAQRLDVLKELHRLDLMLDARQTRYTRMVNKLIDHITSKKR